MRHILISGNRRGLGQALTTHWRSLGHQVDGFSSASQGVERVDVSRFAEVQHRIDTILQQATPDLVIANAAMVLPPAPTWELNPEEYSRLIDINVKGVFHLFRAVLPAMIAARRGVLVAISSGYGRSTTPRMSAYCTSKWAIEGLVKSLAQELPKEMAAVALDPGTLQTDMLRTALGAGARFFPTPEQWVGEASRVLLNLGPEHNGQSLSIQLSAS